MIPRFKYVISGSLLLSRSIFPEQEDKFTQSSTCTSIIFLDFKNISWQAYMDTNLLGTGKVQRGDQLLI